MRNDHTLPLAAWSLALGLAALGAGCSDKPASPPVIAIDAPALDFGTPIDNGPTDVGRDIPDAGVDASDGAMDVFDGSDVGDVVDVVNVCTTDAVCNQQCTDLSTDPMHCGSCAMACVAPPGASAACSEGTCGFRCNPGSGNCDGLMGNGCETATATTAEHCGACGHVCQVAANASALCQEGMCRLMCAVGFANCDADAMNGCETDIRTSGMNCGACGRNCPTAPNSAPACVAGACAVRCSTGFADCDGNQANGCETDVRADDHNCGGCNLSCPPAGTSGACMGGVCRATCNTGLGDCDGNPANGCEADTRTSVLHCGACGHACPTPPGTQPSCASGTCRQICSEGFADCNGVSGDGCEANINVSSEACGRCGNVCPGAPNATPGCALGACRPVCNAGFGDCDSSASNGCELDLRADPRNCGACRRVCPPAANANGACAGGLCGITCVSGSFDCDGNVATGCECPPANATGMCAMNACSYTCVDGHFDCDNNRANGCESTEPCG